MMLQHLKAKQTIGALHRVHTNDDESTVQHDATSVQPPIFSWVLSQPSKTAPTSSKIELIAMVVIGLLLASVGLFVVKGPASQLSRSAVAQQVTPNLHSAANIAPRLELTADVTAQTKAQTKPAMDIAEEELHKLRARLIGASASDRLTILQLFANTEEQYPNDYRFPYERAKLVINGLETRSHDDAFHALSRAAEKAIKTDKTQEMLDGLEADRIGDFHKLSHGHSEWIEIIEALKGKDATLLNARKQF